MTDTIVRVEVRGAVKELFRSTDSLTISGPAGTGKSMGALFWLHLVMLKYPGTRAMVVRKVARSLTGTTLTTYREKVAKEALDAGIVHFYGGSPSEPAAFKYDNGSRIVVGGLDEPQKIMGAEVSVILIDEAIETTPRDIDMLRTRLRGAAPDAYPHYRMVLLTNPGPPTHHLKARADIRLLYSRHEDNPSLYQGGVWTEEGRRYKAELDKLVGVQRHRLRDGRWVAREGIIFDTFADDIHVLGPFDPPVDWPLYVSVDFGFVHPFVAQFWRADEDQRLYLQREIFHSQRLVEDHAKQILEIIGQIGVTPTDVVCDHQIESRGVLERHTGLLTTAADKAVSDGIQVVQSRLRVQEDGRARMFFSEDALVERDPVLVDAGKPTCTVEEFPSYVWDAKKEAPVKENDDGCDAARYMAMHLEDGFDFDISTL